MLLLKNADLYAPEHVGRSDVLLGGGKILAVSKELDFRVDGLEVYDLEGKESRKSLLKGQGARVRGHLDLHPYGLLRSA